MGPSGQRGAKRRGVETGVQVCACVPLSPLWRPSTQTLTFLICFREFRRKKIGLRSLIAGARAPLVPLQVVCVLGGYLFVVRVFVLLFDSLSVSFNLSVCLFKCMCTCFDTYICMIACMYLYMYVSMYLHIYICTCFCMHVGVCVYADAYVHGWSQSVWKSVWTDTRVRHHFFSFSQTKPNRLQLLTGMLKKIQESCLMVHQKRPKIINTKTQQHINKTTQQYNTQGTTHLNTGIPRCSVRTRLMRYVFVYLVCHGPFLRVWHDACDMTRHL